MTAKPCDPSDNDLLTLKALWSLREQGLLEGEGTWLGHIVETAEDIACVAEFDTESFRQSIEDSLLRLSGHHLVEMVQALDPATPSFERLFTLHEGRLSEIEALLNPPADLLLSSSPPPSDRLRVSLLASDN